MDFGDLDKIKAIWSTLDSMHEKDPEGYKKYIEAQMKEAKELGIFGKNPSQAPGFPPGSSFLKETFRDLSEPIVPNKQPVKTVKKEEEKRSEDSDVYGDLRDEAIGNIPSLRIASLSLDDAEGEGELDLVLPGSTKAVKKILIEEL